MTRHRDTPSNSPLTRRAVLRGGALAAATLGVGCGAPAEAAAGPPQKGRRRVYDVIIVGGGFAGMTAARECRKQGFDTLVLEARNRLGGRTFSGSLGGERVDLGGSFVHWTQPFVWAEIQRYGLAVEETAVAEFDEVVVLVDGRPVRLRYEQFGPELVGAVDSFHAESREIWERPYDTHFRWQSLLDRDHLTARDRLDQLKLTPVARVGVTAMIEALSSCPIGEASYTEALRVYALAGWNANALFESTGRYKLVGGTVGLLDRIAHDVPPEIRLATPVKAIEQGGTHATVVTESGEQFSAKRVILAVPLNVLCHIEFRPALSPLKLSASRERHSGRGFKLYAQLKGNLGKIMTLAPSGHGIGGSLTDRPPTSESTLMVAWGSDATAVDVNDEASVQAAFQSVLPGVEVLKCIGYAWNADPYSLGVWCDLRPGGVTKYLDAMMQDEGAIVMAGSDFTEGWRGYIDGAIGSGLKAAQRVAKVLKA